MRESPTPAASQLITGAEYVKQITALESDRRARAAFQSLALSLAPPGGALFDFGAGPGIDARFYAQHGLRVAAYDVDPNMRQYFAAHCGDLIETGRVSLEEGSYRDFLAATTAVGAPAGAGVDLITANFAPLNLISDLPELFASFHARTAPNARVLASVLSPYFCIDIRYRWWWGNLLRLWREGHYAVQGAQAPIVRRTLGDFGRQSAPYFQLTRVFRGLPSNEERAGWQPAARWTWLKLTTCRFVFLMFEKRAATAGRAP